MDWVTGIAREQNNQDLVVSALFNTKAILIEEH